MNRMIATYLTNNEKELLEEWIQEMKEINNEWELNIISDQTYLNISKNIIELIRSNILNTTEQYLTKVKEYSENIIRLGLPLTFVVIGLRTLVTLIYSHIVNVNDYSKEEVIKLLQELTRWVTPIYEQLISSYSDSWEKTFTLQKMALQELSAPLIPIFENITIMPLIGTIDTERARLIMENLLSGVVKHRSDVVLIDITGVPVVDSMVAHYIIQATDAVRLVGAQCMLVGIRPEIAQTIISLGINLDQMVTTSTLQRGIEKALKLTNRKIVAEEKA